MKIVYSFLIALLGAASLFAQSDTVVVVKNDGGMKLVVNGRDFIINGMNWDYFPIGTNYAYSLWAQPEEIICAALDTEMTLLKKMGVNAVRQYTGVPAEWISYIYDQHGIYTMLNHPFGRYGVEINGRWTAPTEYSDSLTQSILLAEVEEMVENYKATPGLLMFLLGNENNYGLFWEGAETEEIPNKDEESARRARVLYQLFDKAAVSMKAIDTTHPIAICNGDLLFMDIIVEECQNFDIFGTNIYRGVSFDNAFQRVKDEFNKPILLTEFGADAFHAVDNKEDQKAQAHYMVGNWKEIYENVAGLGKAGNAIGGFTFQFSDGWWKFGQDKNLSVHDNNASWVNGGYQHDFIKGKNNMNEEWFGICAKGPTNERGLYDLQPRAAYYALQEVHQFDPFAKNASMKELEAHFSAIKLEKAIQKAGK